MDNEPRITPEQARQYAIQAVFERLDPDTKHWILRGYLESGEYAEWCEGAKEEKVFEKVLKEMIKECEGGH